MKAADILTSPLAGTAIVITGLCLLAVPLHRLTDGPPPAATPAAAAPTRCQQTTPAVLRVKLLAPAHKIMICVPGRAPLLDLAATPAGESEYDVNLPLDHGACEMTVLADLASAAETAVFLTVMPDGMEERTLYLTGTGRLEEVLRFFWPHHDP